MLDLRVAPRTHPNVLRPCKSFREPVSVSLFVARRLIRCLPGGAGRRAHMWRTRAAFITQVAPAEDGSGNWLFGCNYLGRESNIYLDSMSAETAEASLRSLFCYGLFRLHPVLVSISLGGLIIRGCFRLP